MTAQIQYNIITDHHSSHRLHSSHNLQNKNRTHHHQYNMKLAILLPTIAATAAFAPTRTQSATKSGLYSTVTEEDTLTKEQLSDLIQLNTLEAEDDPSKIDRPIYDPLGMYRADSPEYRDNLIQPLEADIPSSAEVSDPLRLYGSNNNAASLISTDTSTMSQALPFLTRPLHLDGSLAGDVGFDPLGFASASNERLVFMREAEIKHSRLAMLATAGWIMSELVGDKLSALANTATPLLRYGDRVPSVLNGGLGHSLEPFFPAFAAIMVLAGCTETVQSYISSSNPQRYASQSIGDIGFDPLGMYSFRGDTADGRKSMESAELKHGRLAMLAITAFAMQEAFTGVGVVTQVLSWMHPHSMELLTEGGYSSNVQAILSGEY